jgi:biotin carboxylase
MKKFIFIEVRAVEQSAVPYVRKLGFSPVLLTGFKEANPEVYRNIDLAAFDAVYDIDTHDPEALYHLIKKNNMEVGAVLACCDEVSVSAALLAQQFSLPHPDIQGLKNAYYKDNVRNLLSKAGVKQPRYEVIDLKSVPAEPPLPFPFVIKPTRDAGAYGVHFCRSQEDYQKAMQEFKVHNRAITGLLRTKVLVEEFIEGHFYGAELMWNNDQWKILGINRIFVDPKKSLCMTGISHPSDIPSEIISSVEKEILHWVNILGLKGGAINVEFKLVNNKPVLIEVNLRIAGAKVNKQVALTSGITPVEYVINQACGINKKIWPLEEKPNMYVADAFIFSKMDGEIYDVDTSKIDRQHLIDVDIRKLPFIVEKTGQDFATIIGHVLASGKNCQDAMQNAVNIANKIELLSRAPKLKSRNKNEVPSHESPIFKLG